MVEVSPFYDVAILRIEVPVEFTLKPTDSAGAISVRPGVKSFIPVIGLYGRLGFGLGNLNQGGPYKSVILGAGWQLALLDTIGIFFEGTGEPSLEKDGALVIMGRAGAMLNF